MTLDELKQHLTSMWQTIKQTPSNISNTQDALGAIPGVPEYTGHPMQSLLQATPGAIKSAIPSNIPSAEDINAGAQARQQKLIEMIHNLFGGQSAR